MAESIVHSDPHSCSSSHGRCDRLATPTKKLSSKGTMPAMGFSLYSYLFCPRCVCVDQSAAVWYRWLSVRYDTRNDNSALQQQQPPPPYVSMVARGTMLSDGDDAIRAAGFRVFLHVFTVPVHTKAIKCSHHQDCR